MLKKGLEMIVKKAQKKGMINKSRSTINVKKKQKFKYEETIPKKTLNNSNLTNMGNGSFISKIGNKSVVSSRRKKSESNSIKRNKF